MNEKKLKICHIITRMIVGGAQENTFLSCLGQLEAGHDVTLITGHSPGPEGELLARWHHPNLKVQINNYLVRKINPIKDFLAYTSLKKYLKREKFDVVHTHSSKAGIIGRAAAWQSHVPFVCHTVHGQAFHPFEKGLKNFIYIAAEKFAAKRCHKIYAVANAMINQCVEAKVAPRKKYSVVYSGMDIKDFINAKQDLNLRAQHNIPEEGIVIGAIARLFELKGYEYFIPMAIELLKENDNLYFLIIGDGNMKEKIVEQIKAANCEKHFIFTNLIAPEEVHKYVGIMDILVHLSLREGLPRAAVQALANAKPVVGFHLDGTPEVVINDVSGYTVEAKDTAAVIKVVKKLVDNSNLCAKLGKNGQNIVKDKFSKEFMVKTLLEEYHKNLGY
ncbi:glycosyltransferase family 4 protein [Lentisphaerota bacterium WC36G]|nr:glycosyltransferase family 4 protein [Lentisphaerae bacterium WC36]